MPARKLTLTVSESVAQQLDAEALLQDVTVSELIRRGIGYAVLFSNVEHEVKAHFPDESELFIAYALIADDTVTATTKEFQLMPNKEKGFGLVLMDEYPTSGA